MHSNKQPRRLKSILSLDDFEPAARRFLPRPVFGYIAGAAETNTSLAQNRLSFQDYDFVPNVLVDVSKRSSQVELFGVRYASPFGLAPFGLAALSAYQGDVVLARAAQQANVPMIMSGSSLIRLEDVASVAPGSWFQAYLPGQTAQITQLIDRVRAAGFGTLVITVDTPVAANRENNIRTGFSTPLRPTLRLAWDGMTHPSWLLGTFLKTVLKHGMPHFENNYATRGAPILSPSVLRDFSDRGHFTWDHLAMIRQMWTGPLVVKGILNRRDAAKACQIGADGIIVSNHGGRQLDGSVAPLRVLPGIVDACRDVPVMIDSGVRRGTDVLKCLALGAKLAFVGRPFAYASAIAGEAGVHHAIRLLANEVTRDMGMLGITSLDQLDASFLMQKSFTVPVPVPGRQPSAQATAR
ncbi:alpha-hydroxy acid oxidase [Caballeronia sp. LZ035]|uniref:alpha-hydroxy acid oxidase n=1 Tax=Caballeronia sp. LZ035 TaxID=3038568 RepID=UPI0028673570|nr:alpha-hydroxy acid oxidase [Caballeronia sp. LZ035]MDR5759296.1 alpha-hydroxy acid oxidase [Caballeronia sp. LZ035]